MGQLEKMWGRSKPGWFWLELSTQNCEIEEKHIGVCVTQDLVRTEALGEAGALADGRVQLLLPGPAPLVFAGQR